MRSMKGIIQRGRVLGKVEGTYLVRSRFGNDYKCLVTYTGGKIVEEEDNFKRPNGIYMPYAIGDLVLFSALDEQGLEIEGEYIESSRATGYIIGKINSEDDNSERFPYILTDDMFLRTRTGAGLYFNHTWNTVLNPLISNGSANGHLTMIANKGHLFFGQSYLEFGLWLNEEEGYTPTSSFNIPPEVNDDEVLIIHDQGSYIHMQELGTCHIGNAGLQITIKDDLGISKETFTSEIAEAGSVIIDIIDGSNITTVTIKSGEVIIDSTNVTINSTTATINSTDVNVTADTITLTGDTRVV